MVIYIKTVLNFIDNNFLNYTNKDFILSGKNTYKFNKHNKLIFTKNTDTHIDKTPSLYIIPSHLNFFFIKSNLRFG